MKKKIILTLGLCLILGAALFGAGAAANIASAEPEETLRRKKPPRRRKPLHWKKHLSPFHRNL